MAHCVNPLDVPSNYKDSRVNRNNPVQDLSRSTTLYVGNLSFYTTEEQIYETFVKCAAPEEGGGVKRIIMGLDRNNRTPCGFCFVEFYTHAEALASLRYVSSTKLDERIVRCDLDLGYIDGRQFGRGKSGGQVRDEHRMDYDAGRGGWGAQAQKDEEERRKMYADATEGPGAVAGGGENWQDRGNDDEDSHDKGTHKRDREDSDDDEVDEVGRSKRRIVKDDEDVVA